jgi:hypothetical protein
LAEVALASPPALVAVTTTSMVSPTSEDCTVYAEPVAPLISEHPADEQSCH